MLNLLPPGGICHQQDALNEGAHPACTPPSWEAHSLHLGHPDLLPLLPGKTRL